MSTQAILKLALAIATFATPSVADGWKRCSFDYDFQILNGEYLNFERPSTDAMFNGEKVILFEDSKITIPLSGPNRFAPISPNDHSTNGFLEVTKGYLDNGFLTITYATIFKNGADISLMMTHFYGGHLECDRDN